MSLSDLKENKEALVTGIKGVYDGEKQFFGRLI